MSVKIKCLAVGIISIIVLYIFYKNLYASNAFYYVQKYSKRWQVDQRIVMAIIDVESNGKEQAKSHKGAIGAMQIMPETARHYYKERYKDGKEWGRYWMKSAATQLKVHLRVPSVNIQIGCWYMRKCLDKSEGNYITAISMYNMGHNNGSYNLSYVNKVIDRVVKFE